MAKITPETKSKIEDMVLRDLSDEMIAEELGKSPKTIASIRKALGITRQKGQFDTPKAASMPKDFSDKVQRWRMNFKTTLRYIQLQDKLIPEDLEYFIDKWALYHAQLEDMEVSEEDQLEMLILLQIRIIGNQKSVKILKENETRLQRELSSGNMQELDLENENDRFIYEMIMSNNNAITTANKEFKELSDRYDKILQTLSATREQREKNQRIGGDTFLSLVRSFRDEEFRIKVGEYNERMRIATENQLRKMKEPHTFKDNEIEPIYMDGKDYIK